jgi:hypothetical protein
MTVEDENLIKKLNPIFNEFKEAEKAIKSAETCESEISLTAVNQIRYAFNHLSSAVNSYTYADYVAADTDFIKSLGHCRRSFYDACDAEMTFCIESINQFIKKCNDKGLLVSEIIEDYSAQKTTLINAQKFLKEDQYDILDKTNRYKQAGIIRDSIKLNIFNKLPAYYEIANEKLMQSAKIKSEYEAAIEISKKSLFYTKLSVFIAIIAVIGAVAVVVFDDDLKAIRKPVPATSKTS